MGIYQMTIDGKLIDAREAQRRTDKRAQRYYYDPATRDSAMYYSAAVELYRVMRDTQPMEHIYMTLARCTNYTSWAEIALELARGLPDGMHRLKKLLSVI